jgi:hypothetical protein
MGKFKINNAGAYKIFNFLREGRVMTKIFISDHFSTLGDS